MNHITVPSVYELVENGAATREEVIEALNVRAAMKARMREIDAAFEEAVIAWITEHGEIECGDVRWYVGTEKTTRCIDQGELLRTLLETRGVDAVGACLASGAFKPGAAREVLGEHWNDHFTVTEKPDLKTGKPKRGLQSVDMRFLK
jgi:hypothetical protein